MCQVSVLGGPRRVGSKHQVRLYSCIGTRDWHSRGIDQYTSRKERTPCSRNYPEGRTAESALLGRSAEKKSAFGLHPSAVIILQSAFSGATMRKSRQKRFFWRRFSGCAKPQTGWRREWDSNPRYAFTYTRFPSVRLQPLGHLSGKRLFVGGRDTPPRQVLRR